MLLFLYSFEKLGYDDEIVNQNEKTFWLKNIVMCIVERFD